MSIGAAAAEGSVESGAIAAGTSSYTLPNDTWHTLAAPSAEADNTLGAIFAGSLPLEALGHSWVVYTYDSATGRYRSEGINDTLAPGQAFWIKQRTGRAITLQAPGQQFPLRKYTAACPAASGCFRLPLMAPAEGDGWALVGAPFAAPVPISDIRWTNTTDCVAGCSLEQAAARGYTYPAIWGFDGKTGSYARYRKGDTLPAWRGTWIAVRAAAAGTQPALSIAFPSSDQSAAQRRIHSLNAALGNGINLGNALEAPVEGSWGLTLQSSHFDTIAQAGFDSVRVPIRWSAHAASHAPYAIEPTFFERIDWVIREAQRTDLKVIIDMHHYPALMANPQAEQDRYLQLWNQIATRYAALPDSVYFELLNEPSEAFNRDPGQWNRLLSKTVSTIRRTNPQRPLIVGPVGWNNISDLDTLQLPSDPNLIVTVHFYEPFKFTHQGAEWLDEAMATGIRWDGATTRLAAAFRDWSWDTDISVEGKTLLVEFQKQHAGFNLHLKHVQRATSLALEIQGNARLNVMCGHDGNFRNVGQISQKDGIGGSANSRNWQRHQINLASCHAADREVVLQNLLPGRASLQLRNGEICSQENCHALVSTEAEAVGDILDQAARWGKRQARPIFVGEFGAYGAGDMASRVEWTATVSEAMRQRGLSSAHWEFASGFGAWDSATGTWRAPLLKALTP